MIGAIIGDIIGSEYEGNKSGAPTRGKLFSRKSTFTDDTVLTVAVAESILNKTPYQKNLRAYYRRYPERGFGMAFSIWAILDAGQPYNSWGNGSAMRVSPVGWAFKSLPAVLAQAKQSAECTHNHPDGIAGAQAVAAAVYLSRTGQSKKRIADHIVTAHLYDIELNYEKLRGEAQMETKCAVTVPEAFFCFFNTENFVDAIRMARSIPGDIDTRCCITGAIAEAFYKNIPAGVLRSALAKLDPHLKTVVHEFYKKYMRGQVNYDERFFTK